MATIQPETDGSKARIRSPAYPFISLPKAIGYARSLWDKQKRNLVPISVAAVDFGFTSATGPAGQIVSALTQFGLLESSGKKEQRKVKLSDHGFRILATPDQHSEAFMAMIKRSALLPTLYANLMTKYASGLPSDAALRHELEFDLKFNPGVIPEVVRAFRETVSFANLDGSGTLQTSEADLDDHGDTATDIAEEEVALSSKEKPVQVQQQMTQELPPPPAGAVRRTFTTGTDTMEAAITITSHAGAISSDDIAFLKDYLEFLGKGWSRRKPEAATPVVAPEPASRHSERTQSQLLAIGCSQEEINGMTDQDAQNKITMATRKGY
jgi:hypothetical protein